MSDRFAVISDIHSSVLALDVVLGQIRDDGYEEVFCLGDVVGYGAEPNECVEKVRAVVGDGRSIMGNHDLATVSKDGEYLKWFNPFAKAAVQYQQRLLTKENFAWLAALPSEVVDGGCRFYHGSPLSVDHYILSRFDLYAAFDHFEPGDEFRIMFTGHTHLQLAVEVDGNIQGSVIRPRKDTNPDDFSIRLRDDRRYMINPGSVGQPRDHNPKAAYALVDMKKGRIRLRRAEYKVEEVQRRIRKAGLPESLAKRLSVGV